MKIVTVINDEKNLFFKFLRLSCAINNLNLVTLVSNKSVFFSNRLKDDLLNTYLQKEDDEEIILFTDGNDAILSASEEEILLKFSEFKSDLVFSTEIECWPDKSLADRYKTNDETAYKYLNSGGFIGRVGLIKELLNDLFAAIDRKQDVIHKLQGYIIKYPGVPQFKNYLYYIDLNFNNKYFIEIIHFF